MPLSLHRRHGLSSLHFNFAAEQAAHATDTLVLGEGCRFRLVGGPLVCAAACRRSRSLWIIASAFSHAI